MEDKFIVKIPSVYSVIAGGAFTISAIFALIYLGMDYENLTEVQSITFLIAGLLGLLFGAIIVYVCLSYRIYVDDDIIIAKKAFSKTIKIQLKDINRIICAEGHNGKDISTGRVVTIQTEQYSIKIDQAFVGWEEFLRYLNNKFNQGVLTRKVISNQGYNDLKRWN